MNAAVSESTASAAQAPEGARVTPMTPIARATPASPAAAQSPGSSADASASPARGRQLVGAESEGQVLAVSFDPKTTLVVPAGAVITGDIEAPSVHVLGQVVGNIAAKQSLLIADGGKVKGCVEASDRLIIAGEVGTEASGPCVRSHGTLVCAGTAVVHGDVQYSSIAIHDGADVQGRLSKA